MPPVRPMLAKAVHELPLGDDLLYEPKWDGFRCLIFRDGDEVILGSRNDKALTRYFPELIGPIRNQLPDRIVVDGEIVVATAHGLDFDQLGQRIHPAESRIARLSVETPASFVAFDLLALDETDLRPLLFADRRRLLETVFDGVTRPLHLTPATIDPVTAADWFSRFEGAGFDGVIAKPSGGQYQENKRVQWKVKHLRTADMVVAGYRWHKESGVGSMLLGLHGTDGRLHHVGVCSAFSVARRLELVDELAPYVEGGIDGHPWSDWAEQAAPGNGPADGTGNGNGQRMPGAPSRWSGQRELDWVPLRIELVVEVAYEGLQNGNRLRHPARFVRWRPDKTPVECRYDQLDQVAPAELSEIFPR